MNNQMGMNNQMNNPMGMNNFMLMQDQYMDYNKLRIKNIIMPYENKIKDLEEIIRQKDFEITCLKDKLNLQLPNNMNQQFLNFNPMMDQTNQMINQWNQMNPIIPWKNVNDSNENKEIIFNKEEFKISIQCRNDEKLKSVIDKYQFKSDIERDSYEFIYNSKKIDENLTVKECGISNKDIIFVIKKGESKDMMKNLEIIEQQNKKDISNDIFEIKNENKICVHFDSSNGSKTIIPINAKAKISDLLKLFLHQTGLNRKDIKFLYNGSLLSCDDYRIIKEVLEKDSTITVFDTSNVIGA